MLLWLSMVSNEQGAEHDSKSLSTLQSWQFLLFVVKKYSLFFPYQNVCSFCSFLLLNSPLPSSSFKFPLSPFVITALWMRDKIIRYGAFFCLFTFVSRSYWNSSYEIWSWSYVNWLWNVLLFFFSAQGQEACKMLLCFQCNLGLNWKLLLWQVGKATSTHFYGFHRLFYLYSAYFFLIQVFNVLHPMQPALFSLACTRNIYKHTYHVWTLQFGLPKQFQCIEAERYNELRKLGWK